jgi:Fe-S oxidoreductase/nitrate reductase gamma subunit
MVEATREVFGNIAPWMQTLFYALIFVSIGVLVWRIWRRAQLWKQGAAAKELERDWRVWMKRLAVYALAQKRVHRKTLGGVLHALLFCGFVVLTIGTTLLFIADKGPVNFHHGFYYLFYELTMDVFGTAFCVGCALALFRRIVVRPTSLGHNPRDWALLGLLLGIGITGFFLEAFRLKYTQVDPEIARWSTVGWGISLAFAALSQSTAQSWHLATWWTHTLLIAAFFASIPVTRFVHVITGTLNIALRPSRPNGALAPITMAAVEETERIGVSAIAHFTRQQLLSFDACMECGRCEDACPAYATRKPLSPKAVIVDLKRLMEQRDGQALHGEAILADTLWSCTMCYACVYECPVLIGHVDVINDLRRCLVGEGQLAGSPAQTLRRIGGQFNPYGQPQQARLDWAFGLDAPTVASNPDFEYLLWVGCAGAFDPRAQKVSRAVVELLKRAGVNFAILGKEERCTGDTARRMGEEFLFQEMAAGNIETLKSYGVQKIITPCPHCFNTFKHEYPQFGGRFEVQHHSQMLAELIQFGKLKPDKREAARVTLHDPCYLARVNGEVSAQRDVVKSCANGVNFCEMPRHGKKTFCCGAGGGRMWFEEAPDQRVSRVRAREAVDVGAETLVTACPFCLNMMGDGMASIKEGEHVRVMDIAEMLINNIE